MPATVVVVRGAVPEAVNWAETAEACWIWVGEAVTAVPMVPPLVEPGAAEARAVVAAATAAAAVAGGVPAGAAGGGVPAGEVATAATY